MTTQYTKNGIIKIVIFQRTDKMPNKSWMSTAISFSISIQNHRIDAVTSHQTFGKKLKKSKTALNLAVFLLLLACYAGWSARVFFMMPSLKVSAVEPQHVHRAAQEWYSHASDIVPDFDLSYFCFCLANPWRSNEVPLIVSTNCGTPKNERLFPFETMEVVQVSDRRRVWTFVRFYGKEDWQFNDRHDIFGYGK
jgi:hypothetical protein